jgi:hypothetical protein
VREIKDVRKETTAENGKSVNRETGIYIYKRKASWLLVRKRATPSW